MPGCATTMRCRAVPSGGTLFGTVTNDIETGVRRIADERGSEARLTDERLAHPAKASRRAFQLHRFAETLASPDAVIPSRSSPTVHL